MDEKLVQKLINKVKTKFTKQKTELNNNYEYAFSLEEIEDINKQNKQKIQELKEDILKKKKDKPNPEEILSKIETNIEPTSEVIDELLEQEELEPIPPKKEEPTNNSFINLSKEHQDVVMKKWNEINLNKIDKDIINAKDLLNHNYTITYADDAARFIHYIRKEYEVVITYLIGFNNEKQGILNKTIFSDKIDNEWKFLNSYIKILEKIRNFKSKNT